MKISYFPEQHDTKGNRYRIGTAHDKFFIERLGTKDGIFRESDGWNLVLGYELTDKYSQRQKSSYMESLSQAQDFLNRLLNPLA